LAIPGTALIDDVDVALVEQHIDLINDELEPLKNFVLPGGSTCASNVHLARTCCRRAERLMFALTDEDSVNPVSVQFINRLSDFLFVLSRYVLIAEGKEEVIWQQKDSIKRPGSR
jgi:cob(I)alamin adenosyltransferase